MSDVTPWYQGVEGVDAELIGTFQTKGWDKLPVAQAAVAIGKSYREAEKFVGAPADQVVRLPKDPNDAIAMRTVWQRLGMPKEAKDYDFSGVKLPDGTAPDEKFTEFFRKTAFDLGLPKSAAERFAGEVVKHNAEQMTAAQAEFKAKIDIEQANLAKNWGANYNANMQVAKNAAAALKMTAEDVTALESVVGYARVMDMLRTVGSKIGEDKFIANPGGGNVMTREQAVARKSELMADRAWADRYLAGGSVEGREMKELIGLITAP